MAKQPFLRRLVVIGADNQDAIGTCIGCVPGKAYSLRRAVRPGTGNDRHAASRLFDAQFDHTVMLFMRQRRRFAGCANRHKTMRPVLDLEIDQFSESRLIDLTVAERCDQRGVGPDKGRCVCLCHGTFRFLTCFQAVSKVQRPKIGALPHDDKCAFRAVSASAMGFITIAVGPQVAAALTIR